jgi:hypothetical protein
VHERVNRVYTTDEDFQPTVLVPAYHRATGEAAKLAWFPNKLAPVGRRFSHRAQADAYGRHAGQPAQELAPGLRVAVLR